MSSPAPSLAVCGVRRLIGRSRFVCVRPAGHPCGQHGFIREVGAPPAGRPMTPVLPDADLDLTEHALSALLDRRPELQGLQSLGVHLQHADQEGA